MRWRRSNSRPREPYLGETLGEYRRRNSAVYRRTPMPSRLDGFVTVVLNVGIVGGYFVFLAVLVAVFVVTTVR